MGYALYFFFWFLQIFSSHCRDGQVSNFFTQVKSSHFLKMSSQVVNNSKKFQVKSSQVTTHSKNFQVKSSQVKSSHHSFKKFPSQIKSSQKMTWLDLIQVKNDLTCPSLSRTLKTKTTNFYIFWRISVTTHRKIYRLVSIVTVEMRRGLLNSN